MTDSPLTFPLPASDLPYSDTISCSGYCESCAREHILPEGKSRAVALHLLDEISSRGRVDLLQGDAGADPRFSLDYLYSEARGQMFGVMTFVDAQGTEGYIRAFSGQYNSVWNVPGWVPPIIDPDSFYDLTRSEEGKIKSLGREISRTSPDSPEFKILKDRRKTMSRELMGQIHRLFRLHNFRGETRLLPEAALAGKGLPTGTGECCAPKLLNHAACNNLHPTGITEFYIGRSNRSGSREHGRFYPSCTEKCSLILGFMLCGL